jgi:LysM repeat protein
MISPLFNLVGLVLSLCYAQVAAHCTYAVQAGDTSYNIASGLGCTLKDLQSVNPGKDLNQIFPNDILNLTTACTCPMQTDHKMDVRFQSSLSHRSHKTLHCVHTLYSVKVVDSWDSGRP